MTAHDQPPTAQPDVPVRPELVAHLARLRVADPTLTMLLDVDEQSADWLHRRPPREGL